MGLGGMMGKLSWIDDEKQIIDGKISVGARVDIKYLQYNKLNAGRNCSSSVNLILRYCEHKL